MTGENRRTGWRICPSATFSTTNPIQAGLESSPSLRGDSQAANPPEPWSGPPFVLHLASQCWQTSCVEDRYDVCVCVCVCVCTACPDVAATRGGSTCFPNWHLPILVSYIRPDPPISTKQPFARFMSAIIECACVNIATTQTAGKAWISQRFNNVSNFLEMFELWFVGKPKGKIPFVRVGSRCEGNMG